MDGLGRMPSPEELAEAREKVGMHLIELDPAASTVRFGREGVMIDLGAIGKGYAIERAVELLREAGVTSALLHGGTSTVYALGHPTEADAWKVAIENPLNSASPSSSSEAVPPKNERAQIGPNLPPLPPLALRDEAMSVSAVWGRSFQKDGKTFGHVLDPRTGEPVAGAVLAAVILPSATETDALSTALLVCGAQGRQTISQLRPNMRTLLVSESNGELIFTPNPMR
jgi:thiamine biosynthesis lipoprotein